GRWPGSAVEGHAIHGSSRGRHRMETDLMALVLFMAMPILCLLVIGLVALRLERTKQQHAHVERLKALEMGLPLPDADIARAKAEGSRARGAALIGVLAPLIMALAAVGGMYLVFQQDFIAFQFPLLCVIWGTCGIVSLVAVAVSLGALSRRSLLAPAAAKPLAQVQQPAEEPVVVHPE